MLICASIRILGQITIYFYFVQIESQCPLIPAGKPRKSQFCSNFRPANSIAKELYKIAQ